MWQLLFKDDPHLTSSIWPKHHCQSHLTAQEIFSEHRIPKVLHSNNGPQYASTQFTEFSTSWGVTMRPQVFTLHNQMDLQRHV